MSLLSGLPGLLASAMGHSLFRAASVYGSGTRTIDASGRWTFSADRRDCRALVTEYSDYRRGQDHIPWKDRNAIILAATISQPPKVGDTLVVDGEAWTLTQITSDPAAATYDCRATLMPLPVGDTTASGEITLLSSLPDALNAAMGTSLFEDAFVYHVTGRAADGRGGTRAQYEQVPCKALVVDFTDLQRSTDNIPARDRLAIILARSLSVVPKPGDIVAIGDEGWGVNDVMADPAKATYEARCSSSPIPDVGPTAILQRSIGNIIATAHGTTTVIGHGTLIIGEIATTSRASPINIGHADNLIGDITLTGLGGFTLATAVDGIGAITLTGRASPVVVGTASNSIGLITATAHATESNNATLSSSIGEITLAGAGTVTDQAALTDGIGAITLTGFGVVPYVGRLSETIGLISVTGLGTTTVIGKLDFAMPIFLASTVVVGSIHATLADSIGEITLTGLGIVPAVGTGAPLVGAITLAGVVATTDQGTLADGIGAITLTSLVKVPAVGTLSAPVGEITVTGHASGEVDGTLSYILPAITLAGEGKVPAVGTLAETIGTITLAAAGSPTDIGAEAGSIGAITLTGLGIVPVVATGAPSIGVITLAGLGTSTILGLLAVTIDPITVVGAAGQLIGGSLVEGIGAITLAGAGTVPAVGTLAASIGTISITAAGTPTDVGTEAGTIGAITLTGAGTVPAVATLNESIGAITLTGQGSPTDIGTEAGSIGNITLAGFASTPIVGTLADNIGSITLTGAGTSTDQGTLADGIGSITLTGQGSPICIGTASNSIGEIVTTTFVLVPAVATGTPSIGNITVVGAASPVDVGTLAKTMDAITLTGAGTIGSSNLWTPTNIPTGLQLWFDAADAATITATSNRVSQWSDKSGNANHATASGSQRPLYTAANTNFGSQPTIGPDADAQDMQLTTAPPWFWLTVDTEVQVDSVISTTGTFSYPQNVLLASRFVTAGGSSSDNIHRKFGAYIANNGGGTLTSGHDGCYFFIGRVRSKGLGADTQGLGRFLDNTTNGSIMGRYTDHARTADIDFAELIYVSGANGIDLTTIQKVEGYLAWKWGLQASLDSGHPYFSAAPLATPQGTLNESIGTITVTGEASPVCIGTASNSIGNITVTGAGNTPFVGTLNESIGSITSTTAATTTVIGTGTPTVPAITVVGAGTAGTPTVTKDTSGGSTFTGAPPTVSQAITIASNSNRALLVWVWVDGDTGVGTCTISGTPQWNGSNMTLVDSVQSTDASATLYLYKMVAPATGSHNFTASCNAGVTVAQVKYVSLYNVDQTTPVGTANKQHDLTAVSSILYDGIAGVTNGIVYSVAAYWNGVGATGGLTGINGVPKFVSAGTISAGSAVTSRTPAAAAATRYVGDLEIAIVSAENSATTSTSSTGWNKLTQNNSSTAWSQSIFWRIYNGTNVDPVISWTGAADADAVRYTYRSTQPSGTPVLNLGTPANGTTTTHTSTGGNTTQANSLACYFDSDNANTAIATPSGWTEDADAGSATGPCRQAAGHKEITTSGTGSGSISVTGGGTRWIQAQIEMLCALVGAQSAEGSTLADSGGDTMALASEPADVYNTFGWTATGTINLGAVISIAVRPG